MKESEIERENGIVNVTEIVIDIERRTTSVTVTANVIEIANGIERRIPNMVATGIGTIAEALIDGVHVQSRRTPKTYGLMKRTLRRQLLNYF